MRQLKVKAKKFKKCFKNQANWPDKADWDRDQTFIKNLNENMND